MHLTKENTLDELIRLGYEPQTQGRLLQKDIGEEETFVAETEEIRRQQFAERKL